MHSARRRGRPGFRHGARRTGVERDAQKSEQRYSVHAINKLRLWLHGLPLRGWGEFAQHKLLHHAAQFALRGTKGEIGKDQ